MPTLRAENEGRPIKVRLSETRKETELVGPKNSECSDKSWDFIYLVYLEKPDSKSRGLIGPEDFSISLLGKGRTETSILKWSHNHE